jgi:hypothetical protein
VIDADVHRHLRNVVEHWDQHMDYFNRRPPQRDPTRSAEWLVRNASGANPFDRLGWDNHEAFGS